MLVDETDTWYRGAGTPRLLRCARNDSLNDCHCEERSDEAISMRCLTAGESSAWFAPLAPALLRLFQRSSAHSKTRIGLAPKYND
jgi:hypothetical protein